MLTTEVAHAVGVHPNTVRLYEQWGFLPPIPRTESGYRQFTQFHIDQMKLARLALHGPYPGGKAPVLALVHAAAQRHFGEALEHAYRYLVQVRAEYAQADTAFVLLERWATGTRVDATHKQLRIGAVSQLLDISPDLLRSWERNRLIQVPRDPDNGYRLYSGKEIGRLRVIRMLRAAGYSVASVLRLMSHLDQGRADDLRTVLDTPPPEEDIFSATDMWISTLKAQEQRALAIIDSLEAMLQTYSA